RFALHQDDHGRSRADIRTLPSACTGPRNSYPQANQPHHRGCGFAQLTERIFVGQKTHPRGFRLGVTETWDSRWFAGKTYADLLQQDLAIRKFLKKRLSHAGVPRIEIE